MPRKRQRKTDDPAGGAVPTPPPPVVRHGPAKPRRHVSGLDQLREVMHLSREVDPDAVCSAAAAELGDLRGRPPARDPLEPFDPDSSPVRDVW